MGKLNLDKSKIQEARRYALNIAENTQDFIDEHTTVTVERTVCRLLGIDGVDDFGVPYPNIIVDYIVKHGDLGIGVCNYLAATLYNTEYTLMEIAELVSRNELDITKYDILSKLKVTEVLNKYISESLYIIKDNRSKREGYFDKYGLKNGPLLYVIVATGNIYEDVVQAKAAAKAGADVVAVIRTTGQSLLDFVPYGPTTEGFGGTYATQENFKIMRSAMDEVGEELGRYIMLVNYASG
jgi:beta-lysine 5,6-aminomutase alpha subunit